MVYPYMVKANGKYYETGVDIPASDIALTDDKAGDTNEEYTKTDINRMNKAELVTKATEIGINSAEDMSGNELKELLISHYNL